jgi:hypothetical protein
MSDFSLVVVPSLAASQAPKLVDTFSCPASTAIKDFVVKTGVTGEVEGIDDNTYDTMPAGIFGVAIRKPTTTTVDVVFTGIVPGYSGLTEGATVFVGTDGLPTHVPPETGVRQIVGWAISDTEIFVSKQQPSRIT